MTRDELLNAIKAHAVCNHFTLQEVRAYAPGVMIAQTDRGYMLYVDSSVTLVSDAPRSLGDVAENGQVRFTYLNAAKMLINNWEMMLNVTRLCVRPRADRWHDRHITLYPE